MKIRVLFSVYALLIFAAYFEPLETRVFDLLDKYDSFFVSIAVAVYLLVWFAPLVPTLIVSLIWIGLRTIPNPLAYVLSFATFAFGLFVTLIFWFFEASPTSTLLVLSHGFTLSTAVASSILISADKPPRLAGTGIVLSAIAAVWSLKAVPVTTVQAARIANGAPYCIAHHRLNSAISSPLELRGFSFYSTRTYLNSNTNWHFHGLMVVQRVDEFEFYNWSPRRLRFDRIQNPDLYEAPVRNVCTPD
ncbi:hypothetical protein [Ruegeria sp. EL01]|jgi:hypothetical protein|uniref:hypothetical protein n=1 Tax=Ruegeria sp. EL01 TaxID=2107578 RepID=UPI000EA81AAB|nr:hypothetical protein [Ruegeria sp. EL01]